MKHFKECKTIDDVKSLYRTLAKQHHPDKGGNTATMQDINNEYIFACAAIAKGQNLSDDEINTEILKAERYKEAIDAIINLPGLIIELCGAWIWVTGNTKANREALKAAKFIFASKKIAWYFRTEEYKSHNRRRMSLEEIKSRYGAQTINATQRAYIAA
jgi:hypothetical protein